MKNFSEDHAQQVNDMKIEGKVWKFGDHVDTDVIIPARYLNVSDADVLARHCFADTDPGFADRVSPGDIIVAGRNFGCGSSREHAPLAIKHAGIGCVIAESFARIFYRNAFNIGLPIIESPELAAEARQGDTVWVDFAAGEMGIKGKERVFRTSPIPPFMRELIERGGLVGYIRHKMGRGGGQ